LRKVVLPSECSFRANSSMVGYFISCFQLNALVYYIILYYSTRFEPYCAHHQEVLLYIHSIWFLTYHSSWVTVQCTGSWRTLTACALNSHPRRVIHKEPDAVYTECNRRNGTDFGRVFLMLNCTEKPQNTYIQSSKVTEI